MPFSHYVAVDVMTNEANLVHVIFNPMVDVQLVLKLSRSKKLCVISIKIFYGVNIEPYFDVVNLTNKITYIKNFAFIPIIVHIL